MDLQNIFMYIIETENDDSIMQIIAHYDLFENCILHNRRQAHIRNRNYFEVTIPQYSLSDFRSQ